MSDKIEKKKVRTRSVRYDPITVSESTSVKPLIPAENVDEWLIEQENQKRVAAESKRTKEQKEIDEAIIKALNEVLYKPDYIKALESASDEEKQQLLKNGYVRTEEPLKEEHPLANLLLLRRFPVKDIGTGAAKAIEFVGEKAMPSSFLKGVGTYLPWFAKTAETVSPYADAAALTYWSGKAAQAAKESYQKGNIPQAVAEGTMAMLPMMPIALNPNATKPLTSTTKVVKEPIIEVSPIAKVESQPVLTTTAKPVETTSVVKPLYEAPKTELSSFLSEDDVMSKTEDLINGDLLNQISPKETNSFFKILKELRKPKKVKVANQDQPNVKEVEAELTNALAKQQAESDLPIGMIQTDDGNVVNLQGNLQEIAQQHFGIQNGLINPNVKPIVRAHTEDLPNGVIPGKTQWFGGEGDFGLVYPYAFTDHAKNGNIQLTDLFLKGNTKDKQIILDNLLKSRDSWLNLAKKAILEGDMETAAMYYNRAAGIQIADRPYFGQRIQQAHPLTSKDNTKSLQNDFSKLHFPAIDATEDYLRAKHVVDAIQNPFSVANSLFPINPSAMAKFAGKNYTIGFYSPRPNTTIFESSGVFPSWNLMPTKNQAKQEELLRALQKEGIDVKELIPKDGNKTRITTDQIGKLIYSQTGLPLKIRAGDFRSAMESKGKYPYLYIFPSNKVDNMLYRIDSGRIGLKKGGIIKARNGKEVKKKLLSKFPIAQQYSFNVYPDKRVSKSDIANIETFAGDDWDKDIIHYSNGYNLKNKYPGETSIVYNPKKVDDQDIALEILHVAREQDPIYKDLLEKYENTAYKTDYEDFYTEDGVDGVLRGSMYIGNPIEKNYAPKEEYIELYNRNPDLKKAYKNLYNYINSGYIQPAIIEEVR